MKAPEERLNPVKLRNKTLQPWDTNHEALRLNSQEKEFFIFLVLLFMWLIGVIVWSDSKGFTVEQANSLAPGQSKERKYSWYSDDHFFFFLKTQYIAIF